jgi:hypothetical protein
VKEYDRKRHKIEKHPVKHKVKLVQVEEKYIHVEAAFISPAARRKAASRVRVMAPRSPRKFAATMESLISTSSPRKRKAMDIIGLQPQKKRKLFEETYKAISTTLKELKKSRRSKHQIRRRRLIGILSRQINDDKTVRSAFGVRSDFLKRCSEIPEEKKARCDAMKFEELERVRDFFVKPEVSTALPDAKFVKDGKNRHILQKTLTESHRDFQKEYPDVKISRSKFASLRPANVKPQSKHTLNQCLCEYCANLELKLQVLHKLCNANRSKNIRKKIGQDRYSVVDFTLCPKPEGLRYHRRVCLERKCKDCGTKFLKKALAPMQSKTKVKWNSWGTTKVKWNSWGTITTSDGKEHKGLVQNETSSTQLIEELCKEVESMPGHLFNASWQYRRFTNLLEKLPELDDTVVMVLDFGQNYACFWQDEAQSAHWFHEQITIHPVVAYYWQDRKVVKEEIIFLSADSTHDSHAVAVFVQQAVEHLREKRNVSVKYLHQFSDGCSAQYKSKRPFQHVSQAEENLGCKITRSFFGSRHGKGPCDGATGVVKSFG